MKVWKDLKIPNSLYEQIKIAIANNENYNSVSDFARIAAMKELEKLEKSGTHD